MKRTGRDRFLRNVLVTLGNAAPGDPDLLAAVRHCLDDPAAIVRATAVWAFSRLASTGEFAAARAGRLAGETDALVRTEWEAAG